MAGQSSSHHEERRHRSDRERERSSSHHSRTISSTTLLLVLSLVLAVLAVMLSLPGGSNSAAAVAGADPGVLGGMFSPKRSGNLITREKQVAEREAAVAQREADILAGAPGGILAPGVAAAACAPCVATTVYETVSLPAQTVIKEVVKEDSLTPPGWVNPRFEDMLERELKIAERERDISKREEQVNRREHDASRRESWIKEQLM
mgnify:CR=1 FL=1